MEDTNPVTTRSLGKLYMKHIQTPGLEHPICSSANHFQNDYHALNENTIKKYACLWEPRHVKSASRKATW